jgi:hypothetical protein
MSVPNTDNARASSPRYFTCFFLYLLSLLLESPEKGLVVTVLSDLDILVNLGKQDSIFFNNIHLFLPLHRDLRARLLARDTAATPPTVFTALY